MHSLSHIIGVKADGFPEKTLHGSVDKTIREAIVKDVMAKDYSVIGLTLTCSEETLRERHKKRGDTNECSFFWLHLEPHESDYVINRDNKNVQQIVDEIKAIVDYALWKEVFDYGKRREKGF